MIEYDDVIEMQKIFANAYDARYKEPSYETILLWVNKFASCDKRLFFLAVDECLDIYAFQPSISEMKKQYDAVKKRWCDEKDNLKNEWHQIVCVYPKERIDPNADPYLGHIVMRYKTEEDRMNFMKYMKSKIHHYVYVHEGETMPLLSELIKEIAYHGND